MFVKSEWGGVGVSKQLIRGAIQLARRVDHRVPARWGGGQQRVAASTVEGGESYGAGGPGRIQPVAADAGGMACLGQGGGGNP